MNNSPDRSLPSGAGHLLRILGRIFAVSIAVGTTIGGGILYAPGKISALLPNEGLYLALWAFGGLNALLGATLFAELGAMMPMSGGPYPPARRALGEFPGFLVGYTQWALDCAANAALLLLVGEYAYVIVPALAGHVMSTAFVALVLLTALNWRGVRDGSRFQVAATIAKLIALGGVVVAAFLAPPAPAAPAPALPHGAALVGALMIAMQGVIFSYDSFWTPIFFGEEVTNPGREIPRAIFRGLMVTIPMYLLLNIAFLRVIPIAKMANDSFVGGTAAQILFGAHGDAIIRIVVIISILGTINGVIMMTARLLLSMARDGLFAREALRINAGGSPTTALFVSGVVTAAFLLSGTVNAVLGVVALLMAFNYLLVYVSAVVLRWREPAAPRPYRAFGYPWTAALAILFGVVFIAGVALADSHNAVLALAVVLVSYPVFRLTKWLLGRPARAD